MARIIQIKILLLNGNINNKEFLNVKDKNSVDLIVDALYDPELKNECERLVCETDVIELITWANGSTALILSIDCPSKIHKIAKQEHIIGANAKWVLMMGAGKLDLLQCYCLNELYLIDIGVPNFIWPKIDADNYAHWGNEFILQSVLIK